MMSVREVSGMAVCKKQAGGERNEETGIEIENSRLKNGDGVGVFRLSKLLRENTDDVKRTIDVLLVGLPGSLSSSSRVIETVSVKIKGKSATRLSL